MSSSNPPSVPSTQREPPVVSSTTVTDLTTTTATISTPRSIRPATTRSESTPTRPPAETTGNSKPAQKATAKPSTSTFVITEYITSTIQETSTYTSDRRTFTTIRTAGTRTITSTRTTSTVVLVPVPTNRSSLIGGIIGGVIGSLIGLVIIGLLIWYFIRRQRKTVPDDNFDPHVSQLPLRSDNANVEDNSIGRIIAPFPGYNPTPWPQQMQQQQQHLHHYSPIHKPQMYSHTAHNTAPYLGPARYPSSGPVRPIV